MTKNNVYMYKYIDTPIFLNCEEVVSDKLEIGRDSVFYTHIYIMVKRKYETKMQNSKQRQKPTKNKNNTNDINWKMTGEDLPTQVGVDTKSVNEFDLDMKTSLEISNNPVTKSLRALELTKILSNCKYNLRKKIQIINAYCGLWKNL